MKKSILSSIIIACLALVSNASASTLFFLPQNASYEKESAFIETLYIDTGENNINAIEGKVLFNSEILEIIDIITGDSIIKFWVKEPAVSNENKNIEFSGGMPNGYKGSGAIFKILFHAKKAGACDLGFSEIKTLLNDGKGTEDKTDFVNSSCAIIEKQSKIAESENQSEITKIEVKSRPSRNKWQKENSISLHWDLAEGAEYSYILSRDSLAVPDEIADKPEGGLVWMGDMSYDGLEDGIYYFHIKQKLPGKDWSEEHIEMILIDNTPPEEFSPQIVEIEGKKYLVFSAIDATSGINHYEVSEQKMSGIFGAKGAEQEPKWEKAQSPYLLKDQKLQSVIKIKAIDKAGNERLVEISPSSESKPLSDQIILLILGAAMFAITIIIISKILRSAVKKKK